MVRLLLAVSVLASIALFGVPLSSGLGPLGTPSVAAAPAATSTSGLTFSHDITSDAQPVNPDIEYGSDTPFVWVSFDYSGHDPSAKVTYLVRANGSDYKDGTLDCCKGNSGRFAFALTGRHDNELAGAAYEVRIFVIGDVVAQGGFGVRGKGGLDSGDPESNQENGNGNNNGNGNGNDNN